VERLSWKEQDWRFCWNYDFRLLSENRKKVLVEKEIRKESWKDSAALSSLNTEIIYNPSFFVRFMEKYKGIKFPPLTVKEIEGKYKEASEEMEEVLKWKKKRRRINNKKLNLR